MHARESVEEPRLEHRRRGAQQLGPGQRLRARGIGIHGSRVARLADRHHPSRSSGESAVMVTGDRRRQAWNSRAGLGPMSIDRFAIGFDHRDRERLFALWERALDAEVWSDGPLTQAFEQAWSSLNGLAAVATSSWTGAALAACEFFELRGRTVLCP